MKTTWRAWALLIGGVMVLSLAGASQLAGLVAVPAGLVIILMMVLRGGRPSDGRGGKRRANRASFLGRYKDVTPAAGIPAIVVTSFALWEGLTLVGATGASELTSTLVISAIAFGVWPKGVAWAAGVLGSVAVTARLFVERSDCVDTVSLQGFVMYVAVIVVAVVVALATRRGWIPIGAALPGGVAPSDWALIGFGLLETAAFLVHPAGLDIWADAPGWSPFVGIALVGVVALFAGFAPKLTLALVSVALVFGQLVLASVQIDLLDGATETCGDPSVGLGFALAFSVVAYFAILIRSTIAPNAR